MTLFVPPGVGNHCVAVTTGNGRGSVATMIRRFTTIQTNVGNAITYADSAANGASFTINAPGLYEIYYSDGKVGSDTQFGVSLNSAQLTTDISSITAANRLTYSGMNSSARAVPNTRTIALAIGDVVRPHGVGDADSTSAFVVMFSITKVGNL